MGAPDRHDADGPFAAELARGTGERGRRQAQRLAHKLIFRARAAGHAALADWLDEGFRTRRLTDDGAGGDPFALACTLAAARLCRFVESANRSSHADYCSLTLVFEQIGPGSFRTAPMGTELEISSLEAGELHGTILAAAFGLESGDSARRLCYFGLAEVAPASPGAAGTGTLESWDATAKSQRTLHLPTGACLFRVRFGWSDDAGHIHLGRLEQLFTNSAAAVPNTASQQRPRRAVLSLAGVPELRELSDSRLAADRWDRLLLDGFVANQLVSYLIHRAAARG